MASLQGLGSHVALAQSSSVWSPKYGTPEHPLSLFAEWDAGVTFDAVRIHLPAGWDLISVDQVDNARMRRSAMRLRLEDEAWIAEARFRLSSPLRLVITAVPDGDVGEASVDLQAGNLIPTKEGLELEAVGDAIRAAVSVEDRRVTSGRSLRLESAEKLWAAEDADRPIFSATGSFSVEFWFQTVDRDAVVLSTWDGNEAGSYPFEFVIDAGGNLRCYSGQDGRHFSVVSSRPLADGTWHHVAYVRDAEANLASLYVDGKPDDSVYLPGLLATTEYPLTIGGRLNTTVFDVTGLLDELRIWAVPRDAEKIAGGVRLPGRSLNTQPVVLEDFESPLPPSLRSDETIVVASDLALHQPVREARAQVKSGAVEIGWRLDSDEAQTVTLERSKDGYEFVPIYLVVAGARDDAVTGFDRRYTFTDVDVNESSVFYYRFTQSFQDGSRLVSSTLKVGLGEQETPVSFNLIGNSPNPFVHSTHIFFELSETMHVRLSAWDISGHLVEWLVNGTKEPGRHQVAFYADDLPSGTYFVRMEAEEGVTTRKMILRK